MTVKTKICKSKNCFKSFTPSYSLQPCCSYRCTINYKDERAKEKAEVEKDREQKASEYVQILQETFNRYIRKRDHGKNCISCTKVLNSKLLTYDAGHYFSIGNWPELRFLESNAWGQCKVCNQGLGGNLEAYKIELLKRIGPDEYDRLERLKNVPRKYMVYELKALILKYKKLYNDL